MRLLFLFLLFHSGMPFSTKDQKNDPWSSSCAEKYKGAWWYKTCHQSNLNGQYLGGPHVTFADGINWLNLEVFIILWNVLRWSWGPNSDRQSLDFSFHLNVILFFFSCFKINSSSGKTEKKSSLNHFSKRVSLFCATAVRWHPFSTLIALSLVNICCSHCPLQLDQWYFFAVIFFFCAFY